jgi:Uma2 family endonuclease
MSVSRRWIVEELEQVTPVEGYRYEVLSPGAVDEWRDRHTMLELYSRQGVKEYWIVDFERRVVDAFRRTIEALEHRQTLTDDAVLESPLLPGFRVVLSRLWPPTR